MSNPPHNYVIPWINPTLPDALKDLIYKHGQENFYKKDQIVLHENEKMDKLFYIEKGLFGQAVINLRELTKPFAMNLFTPGRLMGFLSLFSGSSSARRIITLQNAKVISIAHDTFIPLLENDFSLYKEMTRYCAVCSRSELSGMIGLFTMSAEDRLKLLFVVMLCSSGYVFEKDKDEWAQLPVTLRRNDIQKIIYTSQITLDRILSEWNKKEFTKKEKHNIFCVKTANLYPIFEWIQSQ